MVKKMRFIGLLFCALFFLSATGLPTSLAAVALTEATESEEEKTVEEVGKETKPIEEEESLRVENEERTESAAIVQALLDIGIQPAAATIISSESELERALADDSVDTIVLLNDITLTKTLEIGHNVQFGSLFGMTSIYSAVGERHFSVFGETISLTFNTVTLDGRNNGGGIENECQTLTVNDAVIKNCRNINGGAITSKNELILYRGQIHDNIATENGGGVFVYPAGTLKLRGNVEIANNTTVTGGAIYGYGDCEIIMESATLSGNYASFMGGGVFAHNFRMLGGTITQNQSEHGGGIAINNNGTAQLTAGTISSNTADINGGGVFMYENCSLEIGGSVSIQDNEAIYGGGIYGHIGTIITMVQGTITRNNAQFGGGFYTRQLMVTGGSIVENYASENGGGIYVEDLADLMIGLEAVIESNTPNNIFPIPTTASDRVTNETELQEAIDNILIDEIYILNDITLTKALNAERSFILTADSGNAVLFAPKSRHMNISGEAIEISVNGITFDGQETGGGVVSVADSLIWTNGTFQNNNNVNGAAMHISNQAVLANVTAMRNEATLGGGLYISANAEVVLQNSRFISNNAVTSGGGIYSMGNAMEIWDCIVSVNKAKDGAGFWSDSREGTLLVSDSQISYNEASASGGGIFSNSQTEITNSKFLYNTSGQNGGGYHSSYGQRTIKFEECDFIGNRSVTGGGIEIRGNNAAVTYNNSNFKDNIANGGGAVSHDAYGNSTFRNCVFDLNKSTVGTGGAIRGSTTEGPRLNIQECVFTNNSAATDGGAIFSLMRSYLVQSNNYFENNSPQDVFTKQ